MKSNHCLFLCAIIFIVILISLGSTVQVRPYSPNTLFSKEYPYEGFSGLNYTSTNPAAPVNDVLQNYQIVPSTTQQTPCKKVHGFNGLFCAPYVADNQFDLFVDTPGNPSCFGESSGLSNSMGSLCLSASQKQLLTTRGGNQSGKPAQYGQQ